jgi:hypothetical protein
MLIRWCQASEAVKLRYLLLCDFKTAFIGVYLTILWSNVQVPSSKTCSLPGLLEFCMWDQ